jgi:hypothetical protein
LLEKPRSGQPACHRPSAPLWLTTFIESANPELTGHIRSVASSDASTSSACGALDSRSIGREFAGISARVVARPLCAWAGGRYSGPDPTPARAATRPASPGTARRSGRPRARRAASRRPAQAVPVRARRSFPAPAAAIDRPTGPRCMSCGAPTPWLPSAPAAQVPRDAMASLILRLQSTYRIHKVILALKKWTPDRQHPAQAGRTWFV